MKKYLIALTLAVLTFTGQVNAEMENEKVTALLEVTGAIELGKQVNEALLQQLLPLYPQEAHPFLKRLSESLGGDEYKRLIVAIYQKNYTDSELDAMLKFFTSVEGKSIVKKMPLVMKESMEIGAVYGRIQAEKILQEMRSEGFEMKKI